MSRAPFRISVPLFLTVLFVCVPGFVSADDPVSLGTALTKGEISLNLRYRYEDVDQEAFDNKGKASTLRTTLGKFNLVGVYHDFSADTGSSSWGKEFDAHVMYTSAWNQKFALKYAQYSADEWAGDTTKIWLWTQWGF